MAVAMPSRQALPDGPLRRLVEAVHALYNAAGRPGVRQISNAIRDRSDLPDTVSHETVSSILRGDGLPRWIKLQCVIRQLADMAVTRPDPDAEVRRFHRLWLESDDAVPAAATAATEPRSPMVTAVVTTPRPLSSGTLISNVPAPNPAFIGRHEVLAQMRRRLDARPRRPLVVQGIGGVGKTQSAGRFAHLHADRYDVIWWVPAAEAVQARAALAALAERLDLPRSIDLNLTARAVLEALEASRLRWLLIFDNADDPIAVQALVPGGGDVIVTTRTLGWATFGATLDLGVFRREESIELLSRRGSRITPDEADLLADRLGDLPLALEHVAAVQSATGMQATEYLHLFGEHITELLDTGPRGTHSTTVAAMVMLALNALRERTLAAAQLLELFAFLGSEPVPASLLRAGREAAIEPALGRALYQFDFIDRVAGQLVRYGVARIEPHGQRIQVHRLIRSVLREQLSPERAAEVQRMTHRLLGAASPGNPDDPRTWSQHAEIGPHLIASDAVTSDDLSARRAVVDQIRYLERRGEYEESRRLGELALASWGPPLQDGKRRPEDELIIRAIGQTANAMRALGSYQDARRVTEAALEQLRRSPSYGENHPQTLDLAGAVGIYLRITGDYAEARRMDRDVVERRRRNADRQPTPDNELATLRARSNLAVSLRVSGMFAEAYSIDLEVQDAYVRLLGPFDANSLRVGANLAKDLYGLGRYAESLELIDTVLPKQRDLHGRTHEYVLRSARTRVVGLRRTGRRGEAAEEAGELSRDAHRDFGPTHENTLLSMISHANALSWAGDFAAAKYVAAEAEGHFRSAFGIRNPVTLAAAANLAAASRLAGDRYEARSMDEFTARDLEQSVGPRHPYTLAAANGLAIDIALNHEVDAAAGHFRTLVDRAGAVLGTDHPDTIAFEANLGLCVMAAGFYEEGNARRERAIARLGPDGFIMSGGGWLECDIEPPES